VLLIESVRLLSDNRREVVDLSVGKCGIRAGLYWIVRCNCWAVECVSVGLWQVHVWNSAVAKNEGCY
jgi:hypothetical protein